MEAAIIWGIGTITLTYFKPILVGFAKDVAKDMAIDYVKQCFKNVFKPEQQKTLNQAVGLTLHELLRLVEDELQDADYNDEDIERLTPFIKEFLEHKSVRSCMEPLFTDPNYTIPPQLFMQAWKKPLGPSLPEDFSWKRVCNRLTRHVQKRVLIDCPDIFLVFQAAQKQINTTALQNIAGIQPDFDLDKYRDTILERYRYLNLESVEITGSEHRARLWSIFTPQSVRELQDFSPERLLDVPKDYWE